MTNFIAMYRFRIHVQNGQFISGMSITKGSEFIGGHWFVPVNDNDVTTYAYQCSQEMALLFQFIFNIIALSKHFKF